MKRTICLMINLCIFIFLVNIHVNAMEPENFQNKKEVEVVQIGNVVNLSEYGIKENTDIANTINKVLKDIKENAGSKIVTISIPRGNYKLGKPIKLISNIRILAKDNTVITASVSGMHSMIRALESDHVQNVTIEGGQWNCNKNANNGFTISTNGNITIKDCIIKNGKSYGIRLRGSKLKIKNCSISNFGKSGIYADVNAIISEITKTDLSKNGNTGITIKNAKIIKMKDCTISINGNHGIACSSRSNIGEMSDCKIEKNKRSGIVVTSNSSANINKTVIEGNLEHGILVSSGNSTAFIKNVKSTKNKGTGIVYSNCKGGSLKKSQISYNGHHGVAISNSKVNMSCTKSTKNIAKYNTWSGVSITGAKSDVVISYGDFSNNGLKPRVSSEGESGHGVGVFTGAKLKLTNSVLSKNSVCGVSPFGKGTTATIENCKIENNGRHGIGGRKYVTLTVKKNRINNNKLNGIMINDHSAGIRVEGNTLTGNKLMGISVGWNSNANIKKNNIYNNVQHGIYVYHFSKSTINGGSIKNGKRSGIATYSNALITIKSVSIRNCNEYGINIEGGKADIQSCKINNNKESGINVISNAKVSSINRNVIENNGKYGICVNASNVEKIQRNILLKHKKNGLILCKNSKSKNIKNNTFNNPKAINEIAIKSSRANVRSSKPVTINSVKSGERDITGTAVKRMKVTVKISGKNYSTVVSKSGKYTIKTPMLKKGTILKVQFKDKAGNLFYVSKKV